MGNNLNESQSQAVRQICREQEEGRNALREKITQARQSGDRDAVQAARQEFSDYLQAGHDRIRAILTETQLERFDANLESVREASPNRRGGGGERDQRARAKREK